MKRRVCWNQNGLVKAFQGLAFLEIDIRQLQAGAYSRFTLVMLMKNGKSEVRIGHVVSLGFDEAQEGESGALMLHITPIEFNGKICHAVIMEKDVLRFCFEDSRHAKTSVSVATVGILIDAWSTTGFYEYDQVEIGPLVGSTFL